MANFVKIRLILSESSEFVYSCFVYFVYILITGYKCLDCHKSFIKHTDLKLHQVKRKHTSKILFCRYCQWTFCEKYQFDQHAQEYLPRQCVPLSLKHSSSVSSGGYNEDWIKSNTVQPEKFNIYEYLDAPTSAPEKSLDLPKIQEELNKRKPVPVVPSLSPKPIPKPKLTAESQAKIIPSQVVGPSISLGEEYRVVKDVIRL